MRVYRALTFLAVVAILVVGILVLLVDSARRIKHPSPNEETPPPPTMAPAPAVPAPPKVEPPVFPIEETPAKPNPPKEGASEESLIEWFKSVAYWEGLAPAASTPEKAFERWVGWQWEDIKPPHRNVRHKVSEKKTEGKWATFSATSFFDFFNEDKEEYEPSQAQPSFFVCYKTKEGWRVVWEYNEPGPWEEFIKRGCPKELLD